MICLDKISIIVILVGILYPNIFVAERSLSSTSKCNFTPLIPEGVGSGSYASTRRINLLVPNVTGGETYSSSKFRLLRKITNQINSDVLASTCVEEQLLVFLTKWRQGEVFPFTLPQLKLITLSSYEGQYSGYGLSMSYTTGDMKLIGVNDFIVDDINVPTQDVSRASGVIHFPLLTLTSATWLDRFNFMFKIKEIIPNSMAFDNVKVPFDISLGSQGEGMKINDLRLDYTLEDVRVDFADSSWPINRVLNAQGLDIIESYRSTIVNLTTESMNDYLNQYLVKVTSKDLLNIFVANCTNANKFQMFISTEQVK